MLVALLLGMLAAAQTGSVTAGQARVVAARPTSSAEINIVMAESVYQSDGGVRAETTTLSSASTSVVHLYSRSTLCDIATAGAAEPADASFGWRVAAHIVSRSATDVVVSLDWRRLWDRGQKLTDGPSGTLQLTLHPGDHIPLDLIPNSVGSETCRATGMSLEVKATRAASMGIVSGASASIMPIGATPGGIGVFDADVWLLHTQPSGTEQVAHETVRLTQTGGTFAFAPVSFTTSTGQIAMALSGAFRRLRTPTGVEYLEVSMTRVITGGAAPPEGLSGTTSSLTMLPGPGDVVSFEMMGRATQLAAGGAISGRVPAGGGGGIGTFGSIGAGASGAASGSTAVLRQGSGGAGGSTSATTAAGSTQAFALLDGHTFSLRLRLTPVGEM